MDDRFDEMAEKKTGSTVGGIGAAMIAVLFGAGKYGDDVGRFVLRYGDDAGRAVIRHGDDVSWGALHRSDDLDTGLFRHFDDFGPSSGVHDPRRSAAGWERSVKDTRNLRKASQDGLDQGEDVSVEDLLNTWRLGQALSKGISQDAGSNDR